jgi:hypothetical protein
MSGYEGQCRVLLRAFPAEFRRDHGDDLVTALLDDARPGSRLVPLATAADLVRSGVRVRVFRSGAASIGGSLREGLVLSAIIALGLQAALAVASAVYFAQHGLVFYLPTDMAVFLHLSAWGAQSLSVWVLLSVVWVVAFAAAVRGLWKMAAVLSVAASAYLISVAAWLAASVPPVHAVLSQAGSTNSVVPGGEPTPSRYMQFVSTPGFLSIGVVSVVLTVFVAVRTRRQPRCSRTWWWLATAGLLTVLFSVVGDGDAVQGGSGSNVSTSYPRQGGIMTALQVLFVVAVIVTLLWSRVDPRPGWAVAVLAVPWIVHQISDITLGNFYYGYLYQPGWETALPLILAGAAVIALVASATSTTIRLRRL